MTVDHRLGQLQTVILPRPPLNAGGRELTSVKISGITQLSATLELDRNELTAINNALNEVCNGINLEGEFETRMGTSRESGRKLLKDINSLISELEI